MGMDPTDAAREEGYERFLEEVRDVVAEEFTLATLRSYFLDNPDLATPAVTTLRKAEALSPQHPDAALIVAVAACEICVVQLILKPAVYGLVHQESVADFISATVIGLVSI